MPKCWNCGEEVSENAIYCPTCGKTIAPSNTQQATPYDHVRNNQYRSNPTGLNSPIEKGQLERKINNLYNLVIVILVLQVIIFFIG